MKTFTFTSKELDIMEALWRADEPLTRTQILTQTEKRNWSDSYFSKLSEGLLKREAIVVSGHVLTGKTYSRLFAPTITADDYAVMQLQQSYAYQHKKKSLFPKIFAYLIAEKSIPQEELQTYFDKMMDSDSN